MTHRRVGKRLQQVTAAGKGGSPNSHKRHSQRALSNQLRRSRRHWEKPPPPRKEEEDGSDSRTWHPQRPDSQAELLAGLGPPPSPNFPLHAPAEPTGTAKHSTQQSPTRKTSHGPWPHAAPRPTGSGQARVPHQG